MAETIAVCNIKGGIGKTSTIINIADQLIKKGYKVLMVDMDPQRNSSAVYRAQMQDTETMYDIIMSGYKAKDCIQHTSYGDIIANDSELKNADTDVKTGPNMFKLLKKAIQPLEKDYDYILFDTPPHAGVLLGNVAMYASHFIIPIEFDLFAVQGLVDLYNYLVEFKEDNPSMNILGIVRIKYKPRQNLTKGLEEDALPKYAKMMETKVFDTAIRESVKVKEAITTRMRLSEYAPKAPVTEDYEALTAEVLKRIKKVRSK